ncbi:hypothetical protein [Pararobbsia alpina]|uniref:Uncharacterized protein n=1 Tax=Pararobbsia alpina TaxID=621374 RepID=A0A6S7BVU8_9BURK|nr:hypothetical protein [Pararobbsia alpina]CAB3800709.1 hypothetical protein LMG28138_04907 [Pararobbsia alpina]
MGDIDALLLGMGVLQNDGYYAPRTARILHIEDMMIAAGRSVRNLCDITHAVDSDKALRLVDEGEFFDLILSELHARQHEGYRCRRAWAPQ